MLDLCFVLFFSVQLSFGLGDIIGNNLQTIVAEKLLYKKDKACFC